MHRGRPPSRSSALVACLSVVGFLHDSVASDEQWTVELGVAVNEEHFVRTVNTDRCTVILDSGADVSYIPSACADHGRSTYSRPLQVQDAQGAPMKVKAEWLIDFMMSEVLPRPLPFGDWCWWPLKPCLPLG